MQKFLIILSVFIIHVDAAFAQVDNIYFDNSLGAYIIEYRTELNQDTLSRAEYYPGDQVDPVINATISKDQVTGLFEFLYKVTNEESALLNLYSFSVEIRTDISNPQDPESGWFHGFFPQLSAFDWAKVQGIDPGIAPGNTLNGFSFTSYGLPTIVNSFYSSLTSFFFTEQQTQEEPPFFVAALVDSIRKQTEHVQLQTLGPWLPDSTMSLQAFTDTLETYRQRSCEELGWANDAAVCSTLKGQLSDVRSFLAAGDSVAAASTLAEFINLVEQEKDASLSSEGYALLFFNADYLAGRLPSN